MNLKTSILLAATTAFFGSFAQPVAGSEPSPSHSALLSSPRYLEEHPELLRVAAPHAIVTSKSTTPLMTAVPQNRALTSSPRYREEHPEIVLSGEAAPT